MFYITDKQFVAALLAGKETDAAFQQNYIREKYFYSKTFLEINQWDENGIYLLSEEEEDQDS